jgi:hypothetical protein
MRISDEAVGLMVEWIRERPNHPVHIPEHLRDTVRELGSAEVGE